MKLKLAASLVFSVLAMPALAQDVTYRQHIQPMFKTLCGECHGDTSPTLKEFDLDKDKYTKAKEGPRLSTYENLIMLVGWPDSGALMRRLDDGTSAPSQKPGNMYKHLGENQAERAANLKLVKAWVGEGAWNLNRFSKRGDVPAITKEQMDKLKLAY